MTLEILFFEHKHKQERKKKVIDHATNFIDLNEDDNDSKQTNKMKKCCNSSNFDDYDQLWMEKNENLKISLLSNVFVFTNKHIENHGAPHLLFSFFSGFVIPTFIRFQKKNLCFFLNKKETLQDYQAIVVVVVILTMTMYWN